MEELHIRMLGSFSLSLGDRFLYDTNHRANQVWLLLEYLISHRKECTQIDELYHMLWGDEVLANPSNALKNLVYRLRSILKRVTPSECIVFSNGSYSWNNSLACVIDTETITALYQDVQRFELTPAEKLCKYQAIIALYNGDFLPLVSSEEWVTQRRSYLSDIFIDSVLNAGVFLLENGDYGMAEDICTKAVEFEPLCPNLHVLKIKVLMAQEKYSTALAYYDFACNIYYQHSCSMIPKELKRTYGIITKSVKRAPTDLNSIVSDIYGKETPDSALFCDFEVLKCIYLREVRTVERRGVNAFIGLVSIESDDSSALSDAMDTLRDIIIANIRKSDVCARYSANQFIILLSTLTYENGETVHRRITKKFLSDPKFKKFNINTQLIPVTPTENKK